MDKKRKSLTLTEKVEIFKKFASQSTLNQKDFAKSVGLAESSFRALLKRKDKILRQTSASTGSKKKRMKLGKYEELEKILYEWFCEIRARKIAVNGPIIIEKAKEIAQKIGSDDFSPSSGWFDRFTNRYNIAYKQISEEAANVEDANYWKWNILPQLLKGYATNDIYNAAELGLFFKLMPDKCLVLKEKEKCQGGKLSKERVIVLVCSNLDGSDKVKPLLIGKYPNPRCFKNVKSFPCEYESQNRAWMTGELFTKWLRNFDQDLKKKSRKVILFVDHCSAHPKEVRGLKNIRVEFLPPNLTSVLQPMDQGIIKGLKRHYRTGVVRRYLSSIESGKPPLMSLLDAMHFICAAWDAVKPTTITHCFKKAGFTGITSAPALKNSDEPIDLTSALDPNSDEPMDLEEDSSWCSMREQLREIGISLEEYVDVDNGLATSGERSTEEIIEEVKGNDSDEEPEDEPLPVPTLSEVVDALEVVRRYTSAMNDPSRAGIFRLVKATEIAFITHHLLSQATTIIDD